MESKRGAELSQKNQSRRNKTVKREKKKKHQLVEKDEMPNEVEEKRSLSTVMQKKRRRAEEKDAVKMSSEDKKLETKTEKRKEKSSRKKKRKSEDKNDDGDAFQEDKGQDQSETPGKIESSKEAGKVKKSGKKGKKDKKSLGKRQGPQTDMSLGKNEEAEADDVYHISSGDDDCSKGMKKWVVEYHQSRPGLKILQERIDEFITCHEAQLEQERKEREARAAEGGWTVVVHHKGRKKTTDSESGITVGSVAQAAVEDKLTKKKHKEVGLDFYRFQKREAQRNEIMMLQSKFEQDKKRIQQLRAARKFRPY